MSSARPGAFTPPVRYGTVVLQAARPAGIDPIFAASGQAGNPLARVITEARAAWLQLMDRHRAELARQAARAPSTAATTI